MAVIVQHSCTEWHSTPALPEPPVTAIVAADLQLAEQLMAKFYRQYQELYGKTPPYVYVLETYFLAFLYQVNSMRQQTCTP